MSAQSHPTLCQVVNEVVETTPVFDIHTHLFDPAFGSLVSWGIDDLLTYHYLIAEAFRCSTEPAEVFWSLDKSRQADWIWQHLFLDGSPISEACRGIVSPVGKRIFAMYRRAGSVQSVRSAVNAPGT